MAVRLSPRRSSIYFIDKNLFLRYCLTNSNRKNQTQRPDARVNIGIISDLAFAQKTGEQRENSGPFAVISRVEPSEAQDSAAHEVPLAVNLWKNSEKQRELTRNPLVFLIAPAFSARPTIKPQFHSELSRLFIIPREQRI